MNRAAFPHQVIRASAGSGKTHQLTNRFLGLLAAGIEPETILATTFTRKAAGEILGRVLERLAEAAGSDAAAKELAQQIQAGDLDRRAFSALLRAVVGQLHRVRIGTLDSFYINLAGSFSLELGLPSGWSICEPADDAGLRQQAIEQLLEAEQADVLIALYHRLTRGETKRSVDGELQFLVNKLYEIHQETVGDVWAQIVVPPSLSAAACAAAVARIQAFDLSKEKRMATARDDDMARASGNDWEGFLKTGLVVKQMSGENAFFKKPIPEALMKLYRGLLDHARSQVLAPVAEQTKATREFLDRFHRELWALKQASGQLRFTEVTQSLGAALAQRALPNESLAYRLDGAIEHLLLDEFQDTALAQWRVLHPLAQRIVQAAGKPQRSFFCVGDVKQAIYAWRGGMTGIFTGLDRFLGPLQESPLDESRRSAQQVIDAVNTVFDNAVHFDLGDKSEKYAEGIQAWRRRFQRHTTVKKDEPGYVCLQAGPKFDKTRGVDDQRDRHFKYVAEQIRDLCAKAPGRSIGVLCRTNDTIACMIYELRRLGVAASEEGGTPLTDSPAVEVILSLFTLADHPGHSAAWFHVKNTPPLEEPLRPYLDADHLAAHLRRDLLTRGYGPCTHDWARLLAPLCNRRDLSRLQQLIEMAYDFQPRSSLRADDFVRWVREQKAPDPASVQVRVMTIHSAKGLQFDAVVLPELDSELIGRKTPSFVVDRDPDSLNVTLVCRYASEKVQALMAPAERRAFEQDRQQRVEESLSTLYVAMTRPIHALYMFIPGPREGRSDAKSAWYKLLLQTLAPQAAHQPEALIDEWGLANWYDHVRTPAIPVASSARRAAIVFRPHETERRRGLETAAPSQREGQARVATDRLFHPSEGTGMAAGTLYHAWFEAIAWLDDGVPSDDALRTAARKFRHELPTATWNDLDRLLTNFRTWLTIPNVSALLRRGAYTNPKPPGFPNALANLWTKSLVPQQVERERRFLVRDGTRFWNGSFDRIVWLGDGQRIVAADVIDFKTDALEPGNEKALVERKEHYRPQLEAYRRAVTLLSGLPPECIATRLVFTFAGRVVEV